MRFNPNDVDLEAGKVKKDWYPIVIDRAWEEETKNGKGRYVQVDLIITSGEHKGLKFKDFLIYEHTNPVAQQIGSARLAKLCFACDIENLDDELELRNKTLEAYLVPNPESSFPDVKDYRASNHRTNSRARARDDQQMDAFQDDDLPEMSSNDHSDSRPPSRPTRNSRGRPDTGGAVR